MKEEVTLTGRNILKSEPRFKIRCKHCGKTEIPKIRGQTRFLTCKKCMNKKWDRAKESFIKEIERRILITT